MRYASVSSEAIVAAYREHGSVWKAGRALGITGQAVWERLSAIGAKMQKQNWTAEEEAELRALIVECTLGDVARRLGRPYMGVAIKASRLGICNRLGNKMKKKPPRGAGLDKKRTAALMRDLTIFSGSLRQFVVMHGLNIETFVQAAQARCPDEWTAYSEAHSDIGQVSCRYCGTDYFPMSKRQKNCTRRCGGLERKDISYFGGKRRTTVGLAEGRCQLCARVDVKGLSSHHVIGKENDPDNEALIALCRGCHKIVGLLSARTFIDGPDGWETLIHLCMARRFSDTKKPFAGTFVSVEIKGLTAAEIEE